tara:strand:- start:2127 stop:2426 length:300 start_codon:yes stop_codon:yes gene_type:complete
MKHTVSLLSKKVVLPNTRVQLEIKSTYGVKLLKSAIKESPEKIYKYGTYCEIIEIKKFKNYFLLTVDGKESSHIDELFYYDFIYTKKSSNQDHSEYSIS